MLTIGTKAPDFTLLDQYGDEHTLGDYKGSFVLIYFYPKDDTPGCTKQACGIRDMYDEFEEKNIVVLGISKDGIRSHKKFEEKYELPFTLLSDSQKVVAETYNASKFPGVKRVSYLVDADGIIIKTYEKVNTATHANDVLSDVLNLS